MFKRIFGSTVMVRAESIELGYDVCGYFIENVYDGTNNINSV